jgi:Ca-activated chloride channel homolog
MLRLNKSSQLPLISGIALALAAGFGCLLFPYAVHGQQSRPPANQPEDSGAVFRADTRVVDLHATVVDKNGHLVTNLTKDAFTVYENGVQQQIRTFKREDLPVSMGLIVDNSGSMRDKRAKVEAAALALVKDSNPEDEVFVVNFNDEAFNDLPHGKDFTSDIKEMEEALTRIDARGGTAMRDAIRMSIDHEKEKAHRDKKVLVVVTDGNDNSSLVSLENLVKASQQSGVLIYSIGLLSEEERREAKRAERALQALAEATGGEAFFPKDLAEVDRIAHQVARDIRNQYTIVYTPSNPTMDGTFRQIKVTAKAPGNPTVRTRSGYYATPDANPPPRTSSSLK